MIKFLAALLVSFSSPAEAPSEPPQPPAIDLSVVRYIECQKGDDFYTGSGFLIGPHELATARHVAAGDRCVDVATNTPLVMYSEDTVHDFALMSAPGLPTNLPYIKYRCDGFKAKQPYMAYGVTDFQQDEPILRENTIWATKGIEQSDDAVNDFPHSRGMRYFNGYVAPGMSGGPVTDIEGYAVGVVNAGNAEDTMLFGLQDTVLCK